MPPRKQNPEGDAIKNLLKDTFELANAPNPLETLGLTAEAAKLLNEETLALAVKGLYRAWQVRYHPDATQDEAIDPRLHKIQAAYEAFNSDPTAVKAGYKKPVAKRTRATTATASNSPVQTSKPTWLSDLYETIYRRESVPRLKEATLLLRQESVVGTDKALPLASIDIQNGNMYATLFDFRHSEPLPEEFVDVPPQINEPIGIVVRDGVARGNPYVEETELDDGWYEIRGSGDSRSLQTYRPVGRQSKLEGLKPIGTLSPAAWNRYKTSQQSGASDVALSAGDQPDSPPKTPTPGYKNLLGARKVPTSLLNSSDFSLSLFTGNYLVATDGGQQFYMLGRIEQQAASYFGNQD